MAVGLGILFLNFVSIIAFCALFYPLTYLINWFDKFWQRVLAAIVPALILTSVVADLSHFYENAAVFILLNVFMIIGSLFYLLSIEKIDLQKSEIQRKKNRLFSIVYVLFCILLISVIFFL